MPVTIGGIRTGTLMQLASATSPACNPSGLGAVAQCYTPLGYCLTRSRAVHASCEGTTKTQPFVGRSGASLISFQDCAPLREQCFSLYSPERGLWPWKGPSGLYQLILLAMVKLF